MCRTAHAVLSTVICGIQMLVRVFMTTILMLENIFRMLLQTIYNFISFLLQMISLIPICVVFLLTARLKCFMCGGGGPCPVNRGGACDCLMSLLAVVILFFIFRATGVLDKIFYSIGYAKATTRIVRFVPTPGEITECSRNDTDTEYVFYGIETTTPFAYYDSTTEYIEITTTEDPKKATNTTDNDGTIALNEFIEHSTTLLNEGTKASNITMEAETTGTEATGTEATVAQPTTPSEERRKNMFYRRMGETKSNNKIEWTTVLYYLV